MRSSLLLLLFLYACSSPPDGPSGTWTGSVTDQEGESHELKFNLRIDGTSLTGTVIGPPSVDSAPAIEQGKFDKGKFSFEVATRSPEGDSARFTFHGKLGGGHMEGEITDPDGHSFPFGAFKGDHATERTEVGAGGERGPQVQRAPGQGPGGDDGDAARREPAEQATLAAFDTHAVVGLGILSYSNQDFNNFILALLRNPALPDKVNDIVVECGNSLYQPLLDRYIAGENVPLAQAQQVWRNTTQPMCGFSAFYGQLFPLVRRINTALPPSRKLRVLAGDPPVDWSRVKTREDFKPFMERDANIATVVETQVLAKDRKALMIFGVLHLMHQGSGAVARYERQGHPGVTFVITAHNGFADTSLENRLSDWPIPTLAAIKGTWLANADLGRFFPGGNRVDGKVDGYLYLGPRRALLYQPVPARAVLDTTYIAEMRRRAQAIGAPMGAAQILREAADTSIFF